VEYNLCPGPLCFLLFGIRGEGEGEGGGGGSMNHEIKSEENLERKLRNLSQREGLHLSRLLYSSSVASTDARVHFDSHPSSLCSISNDHLHICFFVFYLFQIVDKKYNERDVDLC
jgi:hypothetical protein